MQIHELPPIKGPLWWRKSKWNGRQTVPVVLGLVEGTFSIRESDGSFGLQAPPAALRSSMTKLGMLRIDHGDRRYELTAAPAGISPRHTEMQAQELAQAQQIYAEGAQALGADAHLRLPPHVLRTFEAAGAIYNGPKALTAVGAMKKAAASWNELLLSVGAQAG